MKILINKNNSKIYPNTLSNDINLSEGIIKKEDFNSKKNIITTHKKFSFIKKEPNFKELFRTIKRGPQIITLKDAYFISSELGIMNSDKVLDCGGGSGALTLVFANITGPKGFVVSVEREARFSKIIKENVNLFNFKNVEVVEKDLKDFKTRQEFDAVNLDLPNPWEYINIVEKILKNGSNLTVYVPNTTQLTIMSEKTKDSTLELRAVNELILRQWDVNGAVCRPKFKILGHTGFVMTYKKMDGV